METASLLGNCKRLVDILLCSSFFGFIIILCLSFLYLSCANTKMSVEEAKKITVKMGSESFSPLPRRIDDILMLLSQPGQFDPKITSKYRAVADKSPPENANDLVLSDFYLKRGEARRNLSRFQQALEDLRAAYQYAKNAGRSDAPFLFPLALAEIWTGNSKRGIDLLKRSLKKEERCSTYSILVTAYSYMGDLDSAERYLRKVS